MSLCVHHSRCVAKDELAISISSDELRYPRRTRNFISLSGRTAARGSTGAFTFLVGVRAVRVRPLHLRPAFMNGAETITIKRSWEDLGIARQRALCEAIGPRLSAHNKYYSMLMRMAGILSYRRVGPHPNSRSRSARLVSLPPASLVIQVHHLGPAPISMPDITRCGMDVAGVINGCIGRPFDSQFGR